MIPRRNTSRDYAAPVPPRPTRGPVSLLIGTRKGAFFLRSDGPRRKWKLSGPVFLGNIIFHIVQDPRERRTILMAAKAGHLGPTVFRSTDGGRSWKEAEQPPAFPKVAEGKKGRAVKHVFWISPGHASETGTWYAGTAPHGLFRTADGGKTWAGVTGFNNHPQLPRWAGDEGNNPPDEPNVHSVIVDPRTPRHMYLGMSSGGVVESADAGHEWRPLNKGCAADFLPSKDAEYGHDPHTLRQHPLAPGRLYQQNHCGIYRMERADGKWVRIGDHMPKDIGDIGFPLVLHPRDPDTVWVFPMDGGTVWPRVSPGGKPAAYVTHDAGTRWKRQDKGFPREQGWFTVRRQAMDTDSHDPVGVYVGTTHGEIWGSRDEGNSWACLVRHLPQILSVNVAVL